MSSPLSFNANLPTHHVAALSTSSSPSAPNRCFAAPALWAPVADVLAKSGDLLETLFHGPQTQQQHPGDGHVAPEPGVATTTTDTGNSDNNINNREGVVVATANDYGVVHLELEGDPNCDYTTKINIAGLEFNVIIDTGSSHFAVASNACEECKIPQKESFGPSDEEEIPIDADLELLDSSRPPTPNQSGSQDPLWQEPWNLMRQGGKEDQASVSRLEESTQTVLSSATATLSESGSVTSSMTTTTMAVSSAVTSASIVTPAPGTAQSMGISTPLFNDQIISLFPALESRLEMMRSTLIAASFPTFTSTALGASTTMASSSVVPTKSNVVPSTTVAAAISISTPVAAATFAPSAPLRFNSSSSNNSSGGDISNSGRLFAAASAENLYPISESAQETGQTVRVSYGIKSHSVGWSGVMTSDLLTMEMAKVDPKNINSASPTEITPVGERVAKASLQPGGRMEKETNVEFAAIVENKEFFSPECGAQQGIWGLGYRTLSVDHKPTLFDTLSATMKIPNGFALQLCGRTAHSAKSGNMFLGGYSTAHLAEPMQFVPLVKKDWYQVQLDGFQVMGEMVRGMQNLNVPKTIVDSGTTNILMSHYNLQFLIRSLAQASIVRWSSLIPEQDINNFWFRNSVLRLPRSSFQISTAARAVEVVMSGVAIPLYTSSFLRIKPVPEGQAPEGYVDFWWHGFASSTSPDAIEAEIASGGAVMPGSVGTILGETLFAGKVVYFERGNDDASPGDADFGRLGFGRGKNCFAPANHSTVDVIASRGMIADTEVIGPVRVAAMDGTAVKGARGGDAHAAHAPPSSSPPLSGSFKPHIANPPRPIRLMGNASRVSWGRGWVGMVAGGVLFALAGTLL
ncbi:Beta-secretase 2 [Dissophora globulifera]|uniref:Beta-secretase 2 n=1 Tax=Dissophora globulifera TaxID=979702 RepID=A0A9P6RMD7_9FUNG|nr:Beta-secretase 2 [Dissophora globulifera]